MPNITQVSYSDAALKSASIKKSVQMVVVILEIQINKYFGFFEVINVKLLRIYKTNLTSCLHWSCGLRLGWLSIK